MTYCLAMRMDEASCFLSDTRTNAGVDNVSTYRKLHVFARRPTGRSCSSRPATWRRRRRCSTESSATSTEPGRPRPGVRGPPVRGRAVRRTAEREVVRPHRGGARGGADGTATFLLGGQIGDGRPTSCWCTRRATTSCLRRPAVPADRRDEVRQVPARARRPGPRRLATAAKIALELDDQHRRQHLGRAAVRPRDLPQRHPPRRAHPHRGRLAIPGPARRSVGGHLVEALHELPMVEPGDLEMV